jgi:hypothetical protein
MCINFIILVIFQVTFLLMPLEIAWAITVSWEGGDAMCRIMAFFRTFGLFLSSFVLVCISLDRYFLKHNALFFIYEYHGSYSCASRNYEHSDKREKCFSLRPLVLLGSFGNYKSISNSLNETFTMRFS